MKSKLFTPMIKYCFDSYEDVKRLTAPSYKILMYNNSIVLKFLNNINQALHYKIYKNKNAAARPQTTTFISQCVATGPNRKYEDCR